MKPENIQVKIVTRINVSTNNRMETPQPALLFARVAPRCRPFARSHTR
jgi:hypothetical protein